MTKIHVVFIVVMCALAIWGTEKAFSQITTILSPDGSVVVCQTMPNGTVVCA